jgi:hypothetical protein
LSVSITHSVSSTLLRSEPSSALFLVLVVIPDRRDEPPGPPHGGRDLVRGELVTGAGGPRQAKFTTVLPGALLDG